MLFCPYSKSGWFTQREGTGRLKDSAFACKIFNLSRIPHLRSNVASRPQTPGTALHMLAIHHSLKWRRDFTGLRLACQLQTPAVANAVSFSATSGFLNMLACNRADNRRRGLTDEQLPLPSPAVVSAPEVNIPSRFETPTYAPPFACNIPGDGLEVSSNRFQALAFSDPPALSTVAGDNTGNFNRGSAEAPVDSAVAGDSNGGSSVSDLQTPVAANAPASIPNVAPNMPGSNDEAAGASAVMNRPPALVDMMPGLSRSFPPPPATLPPFSYFTWSDPWNRLGGWNANTYRMSQNNERNSNSGGGAASPSAPLNVNEENGVQVGGGAAAPSATLDVNEENGAQVEGAAGGSLANMAEWPPVSDTKPPYRKHNRDRRRYP
ncbi:hypothetical protein AAG906_022446 [Vitis piasezkii]